ncbi:MULTISPECIES: sugar ABC transporter substrate-binding protein [Metabacillus]|uniref:Sugar ABC transporter substrate-binding protein n=2 Tax=Metabacillus TaxID=2675233 RepID=A0A179T6Q8_9BACI|nr:MULTISPECIES: sugar ABC transporter substrate-binding protein [Metabacillus]OAS89274.1 sugar ABC transporter substrate-binding protein [Metabacillus litoralis]QNF28787.1 sugar ABC transporter substrate-binding protein [Metabacillus sp. KUDC1714]
MKKHFLFQIIVLIMLLCTLVGCNTNNTTSESADTSSNEEKPKVVVVLQSLTSEYWNFVQAGAKQAFKDFNVDGTILGPSSESQVMEQINMMQDALTKGPDALVVSATQPETAIPTFNQYKESDIPVLLINQDVDWDNKVTFIGTDNFTAGKKGGELLASMLQKGDKVALIGGVLGSQTHRDRLDGAKEALVAAGMEVVAEQPADSDKSKAMNVMENIIESNTGLKGVFVSSDDMAMGASRGVQNKGADVQVVGLDGTVESLESVIKDNTVGTVAQNPYDMGYKGVENAIKAIKGDSVEKRIDTGAEVITKENAQERLDFLKSISE